MSDIHYFIAFFALSMAAYWVYADAKNRAMNGFPWALLTIMAAIIGLPMYLLLRPWGELHECTWCGRKKLISLPSCPHCGKTARIKQELIQKLDAVEEPAAPVQAARACPACGADADAHWQYCPKCGNKLS